MTPDLTSNDRSRPVLFGHVGPARSIAGPRGGSTPRVAANHASARLARVDARLGEALEEMKSQVDLATSINAADPQLVLVMEAVEDRIDLVAAAQKLGLEVLVEVDSAAEPDDEYALISDRPRDPVVHTSLHAVCASQTAFENLRRAWGTWKRTKQVPGNAPLRDFFSHLKDIRPWGPEDRLKLIASPDYLSQLIPDVDHPIEIELWYRGSQESRFKAQDEVVLLVESEGGTVHSATVIPEIGYHGVSCVIPTRLLQRLAAGDLADVQLIKSSNVMYLRVSGQDVGTHPEPSEDSAAPAGPSPEGEPVVALLDGVPVTNHPLLGDRLILVDPDELESRYGADERRHGTHMASAIIWGDLSTGRAQPLTRPILVRPIMAPAADTIGRVEEIPREWLTPDLTWRAFRDLFEGIDGRPPIAPRVVILNLSMGDPATPFDSLISAWARMVDWLSFHYGVLVVVSAGNHRRLPLAGLDSVELAALSGDERRRAMLDAQAADLLGRRMLSPAEAINAITVGAIQSDAAPTGVASPYILDATDGLRSISPVTALGGGYRRSIKPELAAPGGRVTFQTPVAPGAHVDFRDSGTRGPGIRVAHSTPPSETFVSGTSVAAALVTRQAARLHDALDVITDGAALSRRQEAVAVKALLAHGTSKFEEPELAHDAVFLGAGHGMLARDLSEGCAPNEAVVLYLGALRPKTSQEILLPLPDGLGLRELKEITATLAWISPVNWRHRQYRQAALSFARPAGAIPSLDSPINVSADTAKRGATTVQHLKWETNQAFGSGRGSNLSLTVKCFDQAGLQDQGPIDYAVALSLRLASSIGVDIYTQIRDQLQVRVRPAPRL